MDVKEIIKKYLKENGFDGLICSDCRCDVDNLVECCCDLIDIMDCKPAFRVISECNDCDHAEFCENYKEHDGVCFTTSENLRDLRKPILLK